MICLKNKVLLGIEYFDELPIDEDSQLKLTFSESYSLIIQTFWRIYDGKKILAMDSERFLLPNNNAPESDYKNLPLNESLLFKNLEVIKNKCLNAVVKNILINETKDLFIELSNNITIQAIINCRCNSYMYYGLFCNEYNIFQYRNDWNINK